MREVSVIGLDLAKSVFQAHGAGSDGSVVLRRKLSCAQLLKVMGEQSPCIPGRKSRSKPVKYDKRRYKRRNRIEIMLRRLKDRRRVATRYGRCPSLPLSSRPRCKRDVLAMRQERVLTLTMSRGCHFFKSLCEM